MYYTGENDFGLTIAVQRPHLPRVTQKNQTHRKNVQASSCIQAY